MPPRPLPFTRWLSMALGLMLLLLAVDPAPLDFRIAGLLYAPGQGFIGGHSFWLETVLHQRVKLAVIALFLLFVIGFIASWRVSALRSWRRQLAYLVLAMGASTVVVPPLKALTEIQCPKDLAAFGGGEAFVPLLGARPETINPGRCWPGGHASTGFSLLALYFALRERRPRLARATLATALTFGAILSAGRMLQGAHFLSHNLWTLLIDWTICLVLSRQFFPPDKTAGGDRLSYPNSPQRITNAS